MPNVRRQWFRSGKGPAEWFTGTVRIDPMFKAPLTRAGSGVTFEPGARTAWHTHPLVPDEDDDEEVTRTASCRHEAAQ